MALAQSNKDKLNFEESKVSLRSWKRPTDEASPLVTSTVSTGSHEQNQILIKGAKELRRALGFKHTFVFIVGILFGSGIFISPGLIAKETPNMGMAIIIWVISGTHCLFGALCYCELSCMYGKAGGEYIFISEAYGKVMGFLVVWIRALVIIPSGAAVLCTAIGEHIIEPFYDTNSGMGIWFVKMTGLLSLVIATGINCVSTSFMGKVQLLFTSIQTVSVLSLVALGIWRISIGHTENYIHMFNNTKDLDVGSFGIAIYNGLWSYDGWGIVASVTEEIENVEKNLWLSTVTAIPFVIVFYVLVNLALMAGLTREQMAASSTVATTFVESILGKKVALVIPFAVAFSCFGCLNAAMFCTARVLLSAAREGHLPYFTCFIHAKRRTPIPAVLILFIFTAIWIVIPGINLQSLITVFSFAVWVQYMLAIFSVVVMRIRKPDLPRPVKVWIINPIFTSLFSLFLVVIPFVKKPVESSICLALSLSGVPVYYVFIKRKDNLPSCLRKVMDRFDEFLTRKLNLVPCSLFENKYQTAEGDYDEL